MLLLIGYVPTFIRNGKINVYAPYDTGAGIENIFLQAVSMDLIAHEMAGFDIEKANALFHAHFSGAHVVTMMAIGYPGDVQNLSPDLQQGEQTPRIRKPLTEMVVKL